jgi:predicted Na+-dependent transporter
MRTALPTQDKTREPASGVPRVAGSARFAPWLARLVLAMASVIFTAIGLRYITDPVGASAKTGVALNTALAYTTTRVGFGAFPLALALFSFTCLLSHRLYEGVRLIAMLATTVIAVRLYSTIADGFERASIVLFVPELILLALALTAALHDPGRRQGQPETWP